MASTKRFGAFGLSAALTLFGGSGMLGQCDKKPKPAPAAAAPAPAPPPAPAPTPVALNPVVAEAIALTNAHRANAGLPALAAHPSLVAAADRHSADQAARGVMSHTGGDGSDAGQRITAAGFKWRTWGENVAYGQPNAQAVITAWMNSAGHRTNILSPKFTQIGLSAATAPDGRIFWTMTLAA